MEPATALLLSILVPLFGSVIVMAFGSTRPIATRRVSLVVTLVTLMLALWVVFHFQSDGDRYMQAFLQSGASVDDLDAGRTAFAASESSWLPPSTGFDVRFSIGLDGLGIWMYGLSAILMVSSVLVSWRAIDDRPALFFGMLLLLEAGCLGVFAARDIILFYVFFEFTLIPLFFLIGIWGSEQRGYAAAKFFLYTLTGSLLTFLGLLSVVLWNYHHDGSDVISSSIPHLLVGLAHWPLPESWQLWIFLALFAGFAIKVPLFPLHTWLPLAHVQAPTAGSVFLAGILLKMGTYGFLRFSIPMLPQATATCVPWIMWLAVIGIIYGALVALVQTDMKRLIAYSSVSHLGFCMLGLFALNPLGVQGAALQMVNHGISTGALFALVGMLYERYHTRAIRDLGGLSRRLPVLAFFMLLFTFSSIGLPGLNGFAGEILILTGAFQRGWAASLSVGGGPTLKWAAVLAVLGVVFGAWYMLWFVQRVFFGQLKEPSLNESAEDLSGREVAALVPLAVLVFWIGLCPNFFLDRMAPALEYSTAAAERALRPPDGPPAVETRLARQEDSRRAH